MNQEQSIETICQGGCDAVRGVITALEQGREVNELSGLDSESQQQVLAELKAVMSIYDQI